MIDGPAAILRRVGKTVFFSVRATNAPYNATDPANADRMVLVLTDQMTRDQLYAVPEKKCIRCSRSFPVLAFIKSQRMGNLTDERGHTHQYGFIVDAEECHECVPPPPFTYIFDKAGKLRMRMALRDAAGNPVRVWDPFYRRLNALVERGIRLMRDRAQKCKNEIRLQPRKVRDINPATGHRYGEHTGLIPGIDDGSV